MIRKAIKILLVFNFLTVAVSAQTTLTLKPDSAAGKDAFIYDFEPDKNLGHHPDFIAAAWSQGGDILTVRSLIKFDLTQIPEDATILEAKLSLYSYDSQSNGTHSTLNGSNACYIQKVTADWDEYSVTWNNQPPATSVNQVLLPASEQPIQDYSNIDITALVSEMTQNPENNFGFLIKLQTEEYYRRMVFASSDNSNSNLHPKLEIIYDTTTNTHNTLTLQPDSAAGKDAYIYDFEPDKNLGDHPDFIAAAWSQGGEILTVRGLLEFDLTQIPENATILEARLSLYSYDSQPSGAHSTLSGSNACYIQKVTADWDEYSVTWNNQPATTEENQVLLPASEQPIQNYSNIDITALVSEMAQNTENNFGFLIKLQTEEHYRRMVFASSDNSNSNLHPKLEITYDTNSTDIEPVKRKKPNVAVYPVPAKNYVWVDFSNPTNETVSIDLYNMNGKLVQRHVATSEKVYVDLTNLEKGIYIISFNKQATVYKKIIKL